MSKTGKVPAFPGPPARCYQVTLANHLSRDNDAFVGRYQRDTTKGLSLKFCLLGFQQSWFKARLPKPGWELDGTAGEASGCPRGSIWAATTGAPFPKRKSHHSSLHRQNQFLWIFQIDSYLEVVSTFRYECPLRNYSFKWDLNSNANITWLTKLPLSAWNTEFFYLYWFIPPKWPIITISPQKYVYYNWNQLQKIITCDIVKKLIFIWWY